MGFSNRTQVPNSSHSINVVGADDGSFLPLGELTHTLGFVGGQLVTDTVIVNDGVNTNTYIQTMTYSGSTLVTVGPWVKQ